MQDSMLDENNSLISLETSHLQVIFPFLTICGIWEFYLFLSQ